MGFRRTDRTEDQGLVRESKHHADQVMFKQYRRKQIAELAPWTVGFDMSRVSVSASDKEAGSPKAGDMIARNPKNFDDQWLVAAAYFSDNFEACPSTL